jgi:hypothetical protein
MANGYDIYYEDNVHNILAAAHASTTDGNKKKKSDPFEKETIPHQKCVT